MKLPKSIMLALLISTPATHTIQESHDDASCMIAGGLITLAGLVIAVPFTYRMCCGPQEDRDNKHVIALTILGSKLTHIGANLLINNCEK
jgi:hypothetical protein